MFFFFPFGTLHIQQERATFAPSCICFLHVPDGENQQFKCLISSSRNSCLNTLNLWVVTGSFMLSDLPSPSPRGALANSEVNRLVPGEVPAHKVMISVRTDFRRLCV